MLIFRKHGFWEKVEITVYLRMVANLSYAIGTYCY